MSIKLNHKSTTKVPGLSVDAKINALGPTSNLSQQYLAASTGSQTGDRETETEATETKSLSNVTPNVEPYSLTSFW